MLSFLCRSLCCDLSWMCEPADTWNIEDECREGERGCGMMYKRGKSAGIWSKRYFVLTNLKLMYYTDRNRTTEKGEIIIAGATAKVSSTRANARHQYYLEISHPECGTRELYAKTNHRRQQWIDKINEIAANSAKYVTYGLLSKQGGMNKTTWQDRWFICRGKHLDYFESVSDGQPKGTIDLFNAKIREFSLKDKKFAFEVVAINSKKGKKKYVFATNSEEERKKWVEAMNRAAQPNAETVILNSILAESQAAAIAAGKPVPEGGGRGGGAVGEDGFSVSNPIAGGADTAHPGGGGGGGGGGGLMGGIMKSSLPPPPPEHFGYLQKKSPSMFKGYQRRFFTLKAPGEILYHDNEEDARENMKPKGVIAIAEIMPGEDSVRVQGEAEIVLQMDGRTFSLKASSFQEAREWVDAIKSWVKWYVETP